MSRSLKQVPERTCMVCGEKRPKSSLERIVALPGDQVVIVMDPTGKRSGRGAYLCSAECWSKLEIKDLCRAFKRQVSVAALTDLKQERETAIESR